MEAWQRCRRDVVECLLMNVSNVFFFYKGNRILPEMVYLARGSGLRSARMSEARHGETCDGMTNRAWRTS